jgi:hypothetical protein
MAKPFRFPSAPMLILLGLLAGALGGLGGRSNSAQGGFFLQRDRQVEHAGTAAAQHIAFCRAGVYPHDLRNWPE